MASYKLDPKIIEMFNDFPKSKEEERGRMLDFMASMFPPITEILESEALEDILPKLEVLTEEEKHLIVAQVLTVFMWYGTGGE